MRKIVAPLLAFIVLTGCSATKRKVDIEIKNNTDVEIELVGTLGPFTQKQFIKPGGTWTPWIYPDLIKDVKISINKR
jgi:hypothetical protein